MKLKCRWWREIILATNYKPFRVKQMSNIEKKLNEISIKAGRLSHTEDRLDRIEADSMGAYRVAEETRCDVDDLASEVLKLYHDERLKRIGLELDKMPDDLLRGLVRKICDERLGVEITFEDKKEKTA